ncbi:MAG TPA: NUDIX domain-containing protein [Candidatus Saccharimonadales bacterium]|nr:NUDIX domain-containing protein [Candidatus Saccharimonadales bacterium]
MIQAAGLLVYRRRVGKVEVLLSHPGGPLWAKKNQWSIPKGEQDNGEDLLATAYREFDEEIGIALPPHEPVSLGGAKATNKVNHIWAFEADLDVSKFVCKSLVVMQWPPRSGQEIEFPENDKIAWFDLATARERLFKNQQIFIDRLAEQLGISLVATSEPSQQSLL